MRSFLLAIIVAFTSIAASAAAGLWFGGIKLDHLWSRSGSMTSQVPASSYRKTLDEPQRSQSSVALAAEMSPKETNKIARSPFDVIRVAPDGVSVFAGLAEPNQQIAVLADGREIGTTKADDVGNWVLATERKIRNLDANFTIRVVQPPLATANQAKSVNRGARLDDGPKTVAQIRTGMIAKLEGMVEAAARTPAGPSRVPRREPVHAHAAPATSTSLPVTVPIPILFVYRTAEFTDKGRHAADLLVKFLKTKQIERATLSGHADERGSDQLNYELSNARLQTVYRYARENGYSGQLILHPRGESEPYAGVDRAKYSQQQLYQLDRRVELHLQ